jgi:hypothetical protein
MTGTPARSESLVRRRRCDYGSIKASERDIELLYLIGEQYAVTLPQLAPLIGRSFHTGRALRDRWKRAGCRAPAVKPPAAASLAFARDCRLPATPRPRTKQARRTYRRDRPGATATFTTEGDRCPNLTRDASRARCSKSVNAALLRSFSKPVTPC